MNSKFPKFLTASLLGGLVGWSAIAAANFLPARSQTTVAQSAENAAESGMLLVNLTTDDTWTANMAISLAQKALQRRERPVTLFLNVRGVYIADRERLPATEGNSNLNIHQKLQAFIAAGGRVLVCPSCSREAGLTQEDFVEGVVLGQEGGLLPILFAPNTVTISY